MSKYELIRQVAIKSGISMKICERVYEVLFDEMVDAIIDGERVRVDNFFVAYTVDLPPRKYKNLSSGEIEFTKPSRKIVCKLSRTLKKMVKEKAREEYAEVEV